MKSQQLLEPQSVDEQVARILALEPCSEKHKKSQAEFEELKEIWKTCCMG